MTVDLLFIAALTACRRVADLVSKPSFLGGRPEKRRWTRFVNDAPSFRWFGFFSSSASP